ncbi:MAG: serine--tRNA ligase, partial [Candidatus Thorarchaeota archaeon]
MLDIRFIRENIDLIRSNLKLRRDETKLGDFERLLELDEKIRGLMREIQDQRTQRNKISREIGE